KDNLNLELKAADERRMIAINELEIFKQQKEIRKLIESRGAEFTNELNAEQLAQYQAIQDKIKQATNERVLAQINFEQEYRRLFRQEQERLLQIFVANQNKIIEENEFRIENERLTLDQTLQLLQDNYQKRAKIIDSELAILDKNNKEDQIRFVELNNEKLALQRDFELQKEQIVAEFTQREISLQEAKNASIIAINNKYNELFKGTLEQQIQRIEQ
ncbi:MAG: hypothetical protein NZ519_14075, partial [Bacteroidia bacterium]|nr:hypothetical protein [Bacteroidia bacterium]